MCLECSFLVFLLINSKNTFHYHFPKHLGVALFYYLCISAHISYIFSFIIFEKINILAINQTANISYTKYLIFIVLLHSFFNATSSQSLSVRVFPILAQFSLLLLNILAVFSLVRCQNFAPLFSVIIKL